MSDQRRAWVYVLASRKNGTLYVGVTTDLQRRIWEHKAGTVAGFTRLHRVNTLVHWEEFRVIRTAIEREKAIKGWTRARKIALIETTNADWDDLAKEW
jgi:putative endonuclease